MRKFICIISLMLCLFFAGCNKSVPVAPTEGTSPVTEAVEICRTGEEVAQHFNGGFMYTYDYYYRAEGEEGEGCVYIISLPQSLNTKEIAAIADQIPTGEHDYAVIDYRTLSDSDMQIRNSYRAESLLERKCVIDILLKYEESHPSGWERSYASMENEWYVHNLSYLADYEVERAMHVNLNNKDETLYYDGGE